MKQMRVSGGFPSFAKQFNGSEVALNEDPERIVGKETFYEDGVVGGFVCR
jgi:hypothetical protein